MRAKFIVAIATVALFISCQKDFSAEYATTSQTSTTSNALGVNNCKASPYFPVCSGSEYNYTETRGSLAPGNELGAPNNYTLEYIGDTTIENKIYQKVKSYGSQITFYNSIDGVLTQIVLNQDRQTSTTVPFYKFTIIKSNAPVGATWRDDLPIPNNPNEIHDYAVIAKGLTRTVFGITYNDVIQIRESISSANYGTSPYLYKNQYFAKGVGLIECITSTDVTSTNIMAHRKLTSAVIP
jgi:hypothetical protein